jgi:hypothetical protein
MQDADDLAASGHRHSHQGPDALLEQDRIEYRRVINAVQNDRLALSRDPAGKTAPDRDPHALPDLFLQACGGGSDQLARLAIQEQDGCRIGAKDLSGPLQQRRQQFLVIQPGQFRVADRLHVAQPGFCGVVGQVVCHSLPSCESWPLRIPSGIRMQNVCAPGGQPCA